MKVEIARRGRKASATTTTVEIETRSERKNRREAGDALRATTQRRPRRRNPNRNYAK